MLSKKMISDIQDLSLKVKDNWSLCEFLGKAEKEMMVATTIHACIINHEKTGEMFSKKGSNLGYETRLCQNSSSYAGLLKDGYLEETDRKGEIIVLPTPKLIQALKEYFGEGGE